MTRALLTQAFMTALNNSGFYVVIDAGGLTATLYRDDPKVAPAGHDYIGLKNVGILQYTNQSVNYDELMRLVRSDT